MTVPNELDRKILFSLMENCRITYTELSEMFDVSVNTIKNRISMLMDHKIILGFSVQINPLLFNVNEALALFNFSQRVSNETVDEIGLHKLIQSVGLGIKNNGIAALIYRTNKELNTISEYFHSLSDLTKFEILPLAPDISTRYRRPLKEIIDFQQIDWLLLWHLRWNGRISISDLSNKTQIPPHTVRRRLEFMRKNALTIESLIINPMALKRGVMVLFIVQFLVLSEKEHIDIDQRFRLTLPNYYWVSWRVVDRPMLLIGFQIDSAKEIRIIEEKIEDILEKTESIEQFIGSSMKYFPTFIDDFLEDKKSRRWFSSEQWERNIDYCDIFKEY